MTKIVALGEAGLFAAGRSIEVVDALQKCPNKMDIYWYGQSCFKIKGKATTVVLDPYNPDATGLKLPAKDLEAQLVLSSHSHSDHNNVGVIPAPPTGSPVVITGPGEFEVRGVSVEGISTFHDGTHGSERGKNTLFHLLVDGVNIVHAGDLGHELTEEQIQGVEDATDILMIPVGGVYTIDAEIAAKVVAQLEPRIVIPMHYKIPGLKYELGELSEFLREMGKGEVTPQPKLSISKDKLPEETQVVVLSKV